MSKYGNIVSVPLEDYVENPFFQLETVTRQVDETYQGRYLPLGRYKGKFTHRNQRWAFDFRIVTDEDQTILPELTLVPITSCCGRFLKVVSGIGPTNHCYCDTTTTVGDKVIPRDLQELIVHWNPTHETFDSILNDSVFNTLNEILFNQGYENIVDVNEFLGNIHTLYTFCVDDLLGNDDYIAFAEQVCENNL